MNKQPQYAVIDADGYFDSNRALVYSTHRTREAALKASRAPNVQVIEGEFKKGEYVYGDTIGRIHARVR